jgi:predicted PurR-regulated permease PerM
MQIQHHARLTLRALRRWLIAQCLDSLAVGGLWLGVLLWLRVPWAPLWAMLAAVLQFIPHFGPLMALVGPALAMLYSGARLERWLCFLAAYAAIALADTLLLQPYLMRRQNKVPIWASLLLPILLGIALPFWGVLLAPPLLAVVYAYRAAAGDEAREKARSGEQVLSGQSEGIILPPEHRPGREG